MFPTNTQDTSLQEPLLDAKIPEEFHVNGYERAGLFSRSIWLWLNPLLHQGARRALEIDDVPELAADDRSNRMYDLLMSKWPTSTTNHPMRMALQSCFGGSLLFTGLLAFAKCTSAFVGPMLIQSFVDYIENTERVNYKGYLLVLVLVVAKLIQALSTYHYNFWSKKIGMLVRSAVVPAVYRKGLRLSSASRDAHGAGQIVNYMSVDVQQIADSVVNVHSVWTLPLQVVVSILLIYRYVGISVLVGLGSMILCTALSAYISRQIGKFQARLMGQKDMRMKATTEALSYMKIIKLQVWEAYFRERIESFRRAEFGWLTKFAYALAINASILTVSASVVCVVTFATCVLLKVNLAVSSIFTAIAIFNILQDQIRTLPSTIITLSQSIVSLDRLNKFMQSEELEPYIIKFPAGGDDWALNVERGCFTWNNDEKKATLRNINFKVPQGCLVAVVGTVGSGKSSIVAALLGEMLKLSGLVTIRGTTAYVPQAPWIQNGTIEENIRFGSPRDCSKYRRIIQACALEEDLTQFKYGDQTEIGERGINLSGGQKQRIQLARALYQDTDIYILDDIFSAVDAQTGSHLFKECMLKVLEAKTRVLVTHQVEFLHAAHMILVMNDGVIVQSGSYSELLQVGGEFAAFVDAHKSSLQATGAADVSVEPILQEATKKCGISLGSETIVDRGEPCVDSDRKLQRSSKLVDDEHREVGRVGWRLYWLYLTKPGQLLILLVLLSTLAASGISIWSNVWLANEASSLGSSHQKKTISMYALLCFGSWVLVLTQYLLSTDFGLKNAQSFYSEMLWRIFRAPMNFFDTTPTGRILTRSSTDQTLIDVPLPFVLQICYTSYCMALGILIVICYVTWPLILVVVPLSWLYVKYQAFYMASSRELTRLSSITRAPVINHFTETMAGFMVVRGFGKEESFSLENLHRVNANLKMDFHINAANEWVGFRLEMIGSFVLCTAALLLVVLPAGIISPELAALSLSYGLSLNTSLFSAVYYSCDIENKMVSVERIAQFFKIPSEAPLVIEGLFSKNWPCEGHIQIRELKARYQANHPLVLKGLTVDIKGRHKIGVVGRTGSGKSTLIQVLFRIIEPAGGQIFIDEVDITTMGLHDLRSKLGIIPQEPILFEGTIRTNMDPLAIHTDDEIWEGLRKCQLADTVQGTSKQLDATVSANGENWSVGQRQLLSLGRALLKKSCILCLDEATASVDAKTDAILQKVIRDEFNFSTVLSIAHRIPTVMDCDKILVMDVGELREYDSPATLLQRNSLFSVLVSEYSARLHG